MKHSDSIVFVVDMVNGFVNEGQLADKNIGNITKNIIPLLEKYDSIFVCDSHDENAIEFKSFPSHCLKNSSEEKVIAELLPYQKSTVKKNSTNAFHCIELDCLKPYNNIIITGCCTDICILQFALSLKTYFNQNNIAKEVIVYEDCVATYHSDNHDAKLYHSFALNLMENSGIKVKRG